MTTTRIIVISQRGRLVGTHIPTSAPKNSTGSTASPTARLVAGPGQRAHELELDDAETYHTRGAVAELHQIVKQRLKLK